MKQGNLKNFFGGGTKAPKKDSTPNVSPDQLVVPASILTPTPAPPAPEPAPPAPEPAPVTAPTPVVEEKKKTPAKQVPEEKKKQPVSDSTEKKKQTETAPSQVVSASAQKSNQKRVLRIDDSDDESYLQAIILPVNLTQGPQVVATQKVDELSTEDEKPIPKSLPQRRLVKRKILTEEDDEQKLSVEEQPEHITPSKILIEEKKQEKQPVSAKKQSASAKKQLQQSEKKLKEEVEEPKKEVAPKVSLKKTKIEVQTTPLIASVTQSVELQQEDFITSTSQEDKSYPFPKGSDVPFGFICSAFERVSEQEGKNSKLAMIEIMSQVFKTICIQNPNQIYEAYMFCILKIAPDYEPNELGVGRETLQKAISTCCGKSVTQIRESFHKLGDLGKVACQSKATQKNISSFFVKGDAKPKPAVSLIRVFNDLHSLASASGTNSTAKREGIIIKFMNEAKPDEICYFIRFIEMNLKIGAAEKTMQASLSKAFFELAYSEKERLKLGDEEIHTLQEEFNFTITRCLCEFPNYRAVIEALFLAKKDIKNLLETCKITIGVPCKPMLAKPTKSIQVILERFRDMKFTCEYKYDGLRGQIHYNGEDVSIFSRNLENMTAMYPDIVEFIKKHVSKSTTIKNFILDSEIVAFDKRTNCIRPFQSLATRGRVNVKLDEIDIKVCVFMFDLILINDESLLQTTLAERRQAIKDNFVQEPGEFCFAEQLNTDDQEEIQEFLEKSVKVGCEGLMVKTLDTNSTYEPAKRSFKWLKLKKDYIDNGLGDTLDLVPIAAIKGSGKRTGFYGAYLLACYNEDMERYETICKIGTGFSDEILEACYKFFQDKLIPAPQSDYLVKNFQADVWFTPSVVWEVKGADLQISPVYTSAISDTKVPEKGIGLRFPRLIRVRDDKGPTDATSPSFIYDLYKQQAVVAKDFEEEDDFY